MFVRKSKLLLLFASMMVLIIVLIFTFNFSVSTPIEIKEEVAKYLGDNNINNSKIKSIGKLKNNDLIENDQISEISVDEVDEILRMELENYAEVKSVSRGVIKENDYISVDYEIYNKNELLSKVTDEYFQVGSNKFDAEIEKRLIGAKKGERITFWGNINSEARRCDIVVKSINDYYVPKVTTQFIVDNYNSEGLKTVNDFYFWIADKVYENKKNDSLIDKRNDLKEKIIKGSKFDIDENEVAEYSVNIYRKYEQIAFVFGYGCVEDYYKNELQLSKDEFLKMCCEEGKDEIKEALIIGAIALKENLDISESEVNEYREENSLQFENTNQICYTIIENKVYDLLLYNGDESDVAVNS